MKRHIAKRLSERLTAEFVIFPAPAFYHGHTGTGPLGPKK